MCDTRDNSTQSTSAAEDSGRRKCPGALVFKTVMNTSFNLTPDGVKEIVVGHTFSDRFTTVVKFYKHSDTQNGIALSVAEWNDLVEEVDTIDKYFQDATVPISVPGKLLGGVSCALEFKSLYNKKTIFISEANPHPTLYPRQAIFQEQGWNYFKSMIPVMDAVVLRCADNEQKLQQLFNDMCKIVSDKCSYYDTYTATTTLANLNHLDVDNQHFHPEEFIYIFKVLKHSCRGLIVNMSLSERAGFNFSYGS